MAVALLACEPNFLAHAATPRLGHRNGQLSAQVLRGQGPRLQHQRVERAREDNATAFQLMATAYNKKQQEPLAMLSTARAHFIEGNFKQALIFAKRAQMGLKQGTPEWIRAEDIITYKPPQQG